MKNLFLNSVFVLALFLMFSFKNEAPNSMTINDNKWGLSSASIVNESYGVKSKFELNLIGDNPNKEIANTGIWLSITGSGTTKLTEGVYQFSGSSLDDRKSFQFNGAVTINKQDLPIVNGSFSLENKKDAVDIHFILKLENGDIATGVYTGKFTKEDRSKTYK